MISEGNIRKSMVYLLSQKQVSVIIKSLMAHINELNNHEHPIATQEIKIAEKLFKKFNYTEIKSDIQLEFKNKLIEHRKNLIEELKKELKNE